MSVASVVWVVDSILWVMRRTMAGCFDESRETLCSTKGDEFLDEGSDFYFLKKNILFR